MIEWIRKFSTSWVARGFFLFLAISFAIMWGGGDLARRVGLGDPTIATVGGDRITQRDFLLALGREVHRLQLRFNETIDDARAKQLGLHKIVLENLINEKLIEKEAARLNLTVTDDFIRRTIKKDKIFADNAGEFSRDRFKFLVGQLGFTEEGYIEVLRKEILKERLFEGLTDGLTVPLTLTYPLYAWQGERRQVTLLTLKPSTQKVTQVPSETDLRTFYDQNEKMFHAPEFRDLTGLLLDQSAVTTQIQVTEEELKEAYETRKEEFNAQSFKKVKAQIAQDLLQQKASEALYQLSTQLEDELAGGAALEEVAQQHSLSLVTFKAVDAQGNVDPYSGQAPLSTPRPSLELALIQEGFRQEPGHPGNVIEVGEGQYYVVRVDQVQKPEKRPFEQVQEKVKDLWTQQQQIERAAQLAETVATEINKGGLVVAIANRYKLPWASTLITRQGVQAPSAMALSEKFINQLYQTPQGKATFSVNQGDEKDPVVFQVGVVQSIEKANPKGAEQEVKKFRDHLKKLLQEDLLIQYLYGLRKKFPVEISPTFQKQILSS